MDTLYIAFAGTGSLGPAVKQLMAFVFLIICMALVSVIINSFARGAAMITGRVAGAAGKLNDIPKKMRGAKAQKSWGDFKKGERFNPNSAWTRYTGGNLLNGVGARVGAGAKGNFGFMGKGKAVLAANRISTKEEMSRENSIFSRYAEDENTMLALAAGNDRQFLEGMSQFRDNPAALRGAMQNARAIMSQGGGHRLETAGLDAVSKSGKAIASPEEMRNLARHVSGTGINANTRTARALRSIPGVGVGGNQKLFEGTYYGAMYNARSSGNFAAGRGSYEDIFRELSNQSYSTIKEGAAEQLFGVDATGTSAFTRTTADLRQQRNDAIANGNIELARTLQSRRQTMFDQLSAARDNPSTAASSKLYINQTINQVTDGGGLDRRDWVRARQRSGMGSTLNQPIVPRSTRPGDEFTGGRVA